MVVKQKLVIGRADIIDLPEFGVEGIHAKVDTGAYTSAIHCSKIRVVHEEGKSFVTFHIPYAKLGAVGKRAFKTDNYSQKNIKSSSGHIEKRFVIKTKIQLFNKTFKTEFSLTDRSKMKYPILLGRKLLNNRFIVDVSSINLSTKKK